MWTNLSRTKSVCIPDGISDIDHRKMWFVSLEQSELCCCFSLRVISHMPRMPQLDTRTSSSSISMTLSASQIILNRICISQHQHHRDMTFYAFEDCNATVDEQNVFKTMHSLRTITLDAQL